MGKTNCALFAHCIAHDVTGKPTLIVAGHSKSLQCQYIKEARTTTWKTLLVYASDIVSSFENKNVHTKAVFFACRPVFTKSMFDKLGSDDLCCVATQFVALHMDRTNVDVEEVYLTLCFLHNDPTYLRHVRVEAKRLYFCLHWVCHRHSLLLRFFALDAWSIRDCSTFEYKNKQRCSVLFKDGSCSCVLGFLILRHSGTYSCELVDDLKSGKEECDVSYFELKRSDWGHVAIPNMSADDLIMPVYTRLAAFAHLYSDASRNDRHQKKNSRSL